MKTSEKEIKILIVLLMAIAAYSFFTFVLKPKWDATSELKQQVDDQDTLVREMFVTTQNYQNNIEQIKTTSGAIIKNISRFYTHEKHEVFLVQIDKWLKEAGLKYAAISSVDPVSYVISFGDEANTDGTDDTADEEGTEGEEATEGETAATDENAGQAAEAANQDNGMLKITLVPQDSAESEGLDNRMPTLWSAITIEANGKYSNAMKLLEILKKAKKTTVAYQLDIETQSDSLESKSKNPQVKMTISLYFLNLTNPNLHSLDTSKLKGKETLYQIPEMNPTFIMPEDFVNGDYRKDFSIGQIRDAVVDVVSKAGEGIRGLIDKIKG